MTGLYNRIMEQTTLKGMSGKELGSLLGLKKSPLTDWKNGKSSPTLDQIVMMCEVFATSSDYLIYGKSSSFLTDDQAELLSTYNQLDSRGRHRVHTIIYEEIDRMNGVAAPAEASASRSVSKKTII